MITFSSLLSSLPQKEAVEGTSQTTPNCKRKHPSHMKASLLIQAESFPPLFRSASPVMTYAPIIGSCLSPTSKVPRGDAKRSGEEEPTPWIGGVTEKRMFDTSFCSPTSETCGRRQGLCSCLFPLIMGQPLGIKKVQEFNLFL